MAEIVKDLTQFILKGMILNAPPELLDKGYYQYLQNIRVTEEGVIISRPKINIIGSLPTSTDVINSIRTLFDKPTNTTLGIVCAGDKVFTGDYYTGLNEKDNGYSNKPKSLVAFRNENSISASMILADENKLSEVTIDGEVNTLGIDAPHYAPTYKRVQPDRKIIDNCDDETVWKNDGVADVPTVVTRINTDINYIKYDEGTSGACNIIPSEFSSDLLEGTILYIHGETTFVEEVLKSPLSSTTIKAIQLISHTVCEITCMNSNGQVKVGDILIADSDKFLKVLEIADSVGNDFSYKIETLDTSLLIIGQTIEGAQSFRCYLNNTHVIGEVIFAEALEISMTGEGLGGITKYGAFDFTRGVNRNLNDDSILYIAVKSSSLSSLDSFQIQLGIDGFDSNYYFFEISANDFVEVTSQSTPDIAIRQRLAQIQEVINGSNAPHVYFGGHLQPVDNGDGFVPFVDVEGTTLTNLGDEQYSIFKIPFNKFKRSGTDESRGWRDISQIRFSFKVNSAVDMTIDSIWIGGDSKLIATDGFLAYNYVYRYEIENQGHISNWSPPFRNGIRIDRSSLELYATPSDDLRVDKIEWARFGGTQNSFRVLGKSNINEPFIDEYSDAQVADNDRADRNGDFDFFKPFPILDINRRGRCNVIGTQLQVIDGDALKTSYPRGTYIYVNGVLNQFYTNPNTSKEVELEKSMGTLDNVDFFIKTPIMVGQPLPIIFGTFGQGNQALINFALGDNLNPNILYWLDPNTISTASDRNKLEITSPNEVLLNGIMYDDFAYVFTNYRSFWITPTYDNSGNLGFIARKNAGSKGLFARDAICSCEDGIFYQSVDGIYIVKGTGIPVSITDNALYNLFPQNGILPKPIILSNNNIFHPPNFSLVDEFRLFHIRGKVHWRFIDTNNEQVTLVYDIKRNCWTSKDTYIDEVIGVIVEDEQESDFDVLLGFDGKLGTYDNTGTYDNGLYSEIIMPERDFNEPTLIKNFENLIVDAYLENEDLDAILLLDAIQYPNTLNSLTPNKRNIYYVDKDIEVIKMGVIYRWPISSTLKLFRERLAFIPKANIITNEATDFLDMGFLGEKFWERLIIECDTFGEDKQLILETDDGAIYEFPELLINHSGQQVRTYSFSPFIAHKVRIKSNDNKKWILYNQRFIIDVEAELGTSFKTQLTNHDLVGLQHIKLITLSYVSEVDLELILNIDNTFYSYIFESTKTIQQRVTKFISPVKGQLFEYEIKSMEGKEFRFYKKHSIVHVKQENSNEDYIIKRPFGDISRETELKNV